MSMLTSTGARPKDQLISMEPAKEPINVSQRRRAPLRVALVNMPFGSTRYPSIQLGLLQAILARHGITATTHYLNLRFAASFGWEKYEVLCDPLCRYLGEWIFSGVAFADDAPEGGHLLSIFADNVRRVCTELDCDPAYLLDLREREAPAFIEDCLAVVPWQEYDVIGFSSVFEQNCAALALARRLKERNPRLITVFGGANFEDEMGLEYVRALPWIDYAVIGEGDEVFPTLLERLAAGEEVLGMPGVACRNDDGVIFTGGAPMVQNLDALPEPDYNDYFSAAAALKHPNTTGLATVHIMYESARGCWWGQKHHCTFCGLNGLGMAYRSKSPARVLAEIDELARRYQVHWFTAVDNILDQRYIKEVFGSLIEQRIDYGFFWAVKANLTQTQLRVLARGGVDRLQPGIESLSTHILKLMRKGTTAIQNVCFLKWAAYYGISVAWNVLLGFPGEDPQDYAQQLATIQLIPHLEPPSGCTRIWLERFSPNYVQAEDLGIRNVRADRAYACIYPDHLNGERIAYFFDYDAPDTVPAEVHESLRAHIRWWKEAWRASRRPYLTYLRGARRLTVIDGRQLDAPRVHLFDEPAALAYEFCGPTQHNAMRVMAYLRDERGLDMDLPAVQHDLDAFTALGLMLEEDGHYLSLALPTNPHW